MRTDPPPSVPTDHVPMPSPTAVAAPPLEPPDVRPAPHGLPVAPCRIESVTPFQANSGVVFLPRRTAPLSRRRATAGASTSQGWDSSTSVEPRSVGQPRVSSMSLIEAGTPSAGPERVPRLPAPRRRPGLRQRCLLVHQDERVDLAVMGARWRPAQRVRRPRGRELAGAVAVDELDRRHHRQVGHGRPARNVAQRGVDDVLQWLAGEPALGVGDELAGQRVAPADHVAGHVGRDDHLRERPRAVSRPAAAPARTRRARRRRARRPTTPRPDRIRPPSRRARR